MQAGCRQPTVKRDASASWMERKGIMTTIAIMCKDVGITEWVQADGIRALHTRTNSNVVFSHESSMKRKCSSAFTRHICACNYVHCSGSKVGCWFI